jgi:hypothetical protein
MTIQLLGSNEAGRLDVCFYDKGVAGPIEGYIHYTNYPDHTHYVPHNLDGVALGEGSSNPIAEAAKVIRNFRERENEVVMTRVMEMKVELYTATGATKSSLEKRILDAYAYADRIASGEFS